MLSDEKLPLMFNPLTSLILSLMKIIVTCSLILSMSASVLFSSESYIAMEAHTGKVLLAAKPEQKRPVASLAMIATAKVVLDWADASQTSLASQAFVPQSAFAFQSSNPMGLRPGDRVTLRDAIYSALMGSDNIAAHTLADHVGRAILAHRRQAGDPQKIFVAEMNYLAKALGMRRTRFGNSHGLNHVGRKSYSTASDIARLCVHVMRDTGFAFYVKQKSRNIYVNKAGGRKLAFKVTNANPLLGVFGINGIKSGASVSAGQCLAVNAHRSPLVKKLSDDRAQIRYRDLIVVVLGSNDVAVRSKQLISQAWPMYDGWAASGYQQNAQSSKLIVVPKIR